MSIGMICYVIAIILMVFGSIQFPSRINLWNLGWAFVILAFVFGGRL